MRGLLQDYSSSLQPKGLNLAPLIDVIFQLILFFMVTSSFTWYSGMQVKVPKASQSVMDRPLEAITLEIVRGNSQIQPEPLIVKWWEQGTEGTVFYPLAENVDPMSGLATLITSLEEYKKSLGPDRIPSVVIAAGDDVPYQCVITVIDMCHRLLLTDIVLAVQRSGGGADLSGQINMQNSTP